MHQSNVKADVKVKFNQLPIGDLSGIEVTDLGFIMIKATHEGASTNIIVGRIDSLESINAKLKFELIDELPVESEPSSEAHSE